MRNGLIYKKFSDEVFTGTVDGLAKGEVKKGIKVGEWSFWHENGQLAAKGIFLNNQMEGSWKHYLEDGTVNWFLTGIYKNGKKVKK